MSKGVNKVILLGNVGKDPEMRATPGGLVIAQFSLATADRRKQGDQWVDATEWHNLIAFGRTAEIIRDYVTKGKQLYIEGKLQTTSWDDKESGQKKYRTQIVINDLALLGGGRDDRQSSGSGGGGYKPSSGGGYAGNDYDQNEGITDDDIPF